MLEICKLRDVGNHHKCRRIMLKRNGARGRASEQGGDALIEEMTLILALQDEM